MPPVRQHRIGDQMPAITHAGPDPNAIALCQDLMAQAPVDCTILFGSRALGGWGDQSDLDIIVIHQAAGDDAQEPSLVGLAINQLRQLHYPGYLAYESPHHGVVDGLIVETPEDYRARRRTQNHVMARAAREGLVFCKEPGNEHRYRHDGDVSIEWELVTTKRLRAAASENRMLSEVPPVLAPASSQQVQREHRSRTKRPLAAVELRRSAPVHPGRRLPQRLHGGDGPFHRPARRRLEPHLPERP